MGYAALTAVALTVKPSAATPTSSLRPLLLNLVRVGISAGLLGWVVAQAGGLDKLLATAQQADSRPYLFAILLAFAGIVIRSYRWQILLQAVGVQLPFGRVVYLYFVGAFFNTFLPTGFGGDVVRVLEIGDNASSQQATGTVLIDRLTGFVGLFLLALVALPFAYNLLPPATTLLITLAAVGVVTGSVLLVEGRILRWVTQYFPRALSLAGDAWLGKTYAVITSCGWRAILGALGMSVVYNLSLIWASVLVSQALALDISVWTWLLFTPVGAASLLLPSISGIGVRESVFVTLFRQINIGEAQAVTFSLAWLSLDLAAGLLGGVIYLVGGMAGVLKKEPR